MNIALIPNWVRDSLWRSGHKYEDLQNLSKLMQVLSTRELAILVTLQSPTYQKLIFGAPVGDKAIDFLALWSVNSIASLQGAVDKIAEYIKYNELGEEIQARLFERYESSTTNEHQTLTEVAGLGLAVTVMPNTYFGENHAKNSSALSREVCKRLYKYEGMGKLLANPLGAKYIETLSR